jgi:hypothetical protein
MGAEGAPQALVISCIGEIIAPVRVGGDRRIVLFGRQVEWATAGPATHDFGRYQIPVIRHCHTAGRVDSTCAASAPTSFKQSDNTDFPVVFDTLDGGTYAISRAATCASAFVSDDFRCSELTLTPSAAMTSGLAMPMKASTLFR